MGGQTALMCAVWRTVSPECIDLLIKAGADMDIQDGVRYFYYALTYVILPYIIIETYDCTYVGCQLFLSRACRVY